MYKNLLALALATGGLSTCAMADILTFDINSYAARATDGFNGTGAESFGGITHTGSISFWKGASTTLTEVRLSDDTFATLQSSSSGTLAGLSGVINFVNGASTGGSISLMVQNADNSLHAYSATISPSISFDDIQVEASAAGPRWFITQATESGSADSNYAGIDSSMFAAGSPDLVGALIVHQFNPSQQSGAQLEISVIAVPEPASLGAVGLGAAGLLRRRRRA